MNHGSLFSGIGGFDLAAEWMGWKNKFHCEWNEFGQRILKYYWPNAESYGDITKTDFTIWRGKIDILTGGFPCQPFSTSGRRKGTTDNRYLWPEYLRAIRESKPTTIVGENVTGILSMGKYEVFAKVDSRSVIRFEDIDKYEAIYIRQEKMLVNSICEDLEKEGYKVQPFVIPAAGVGAPHKRDRIWIIADSSDTRIKSMQKQENRTNKYRYVTNSEMFRRNEGEIKKSGEDKKSQGQIRGLCCDETVTNSKNKRLPERNGESAQFRTYPTIERYSSLLQWANFPTQSPVFSRDDGISNGLDGITVSDWRKKSIEGYGNAIVPQVYYEICQAIEHTQKMQINEK